jgi:hypothetical protein
MIGTRTAALVCIIAVCVLISFNAAPASGDVATPGKPASPGGLYTGQYGDDTLAVTLRPTGDLPTTSESSPLDAPKVIVAKEPLSFVTVALSIVGIILYLRHVVKHSNNPSPSVVHSLDHRCDPGTQSYSRTGGVPRQGHAQARNSEVPPKSADAAERRKRAHEHLRGCGITWQKMRAGKIYRGWLNDISLDGMSLYVQESERPEVGDSIVILPKGESDEVRAECKVTRVGPHAEGLVLISCLLDYGPLGFFDACAELILSRWL